MESRSLKKVEYFITVDNFMVVLVRKTRLGTTVKKGFFFVFFFLLFFFFFFQITDLSLKIEICMVLYVFHI